MLRCCYNMRTPHPNRKRPNTTTHAGDAPEHQAPARILSPHELLVMKNRAGHTPVIKAFAGGVHVAVIRYVGGCAYDSSRARTRLSPLVIYV